MEVKHDIPVPAWRDLWRGSAVMMDAHTLEAGTCHLDVRRRRGGCEWAAKASAERLFAVAAGMLDLKVT